MLKVSVVTVYAMKIKAVVKAVFFFCQKWGSLVKFEKGNPQYCVLKRIRHNNTNNNRLCPYLLLILTLLKYNNCKFWEFFKNIVV
jgi:hypothetical protein